MVDTVQSGKPNHDKDASQPKVSRKLTSKGGNAEVTPLTKRRALDEGSDTNAGGTTKTGLGED